MVADQYPSTSLINWGACKPGGYLATRTWLRNYHTSMLYYMNLVATYKTLRFSEFSSLSVFRPILVTMLKSRDPTAAHNLPH